MTEPDDRLMTRYHDLWLRFAGWAPDDTLATARRLLTEGQFAQVADAALGVVRTRRVPVTPEDVELLGIVATESPTAADDSGHPEYDFAPLLPGPFDLEPAPLVLDLTSPGPTAPDDPDYAAIATLAQIDGPVALWRAWRSPQPDRVEHGPVRIYLLELATDGPELVAATGALQEFLTAAGVTDPQVEVFGPGTDLPAYQRAARGRSALLWAAAPPEPVLIARVFDSWDPLLGGQFEVDHPILSDGPEPQRVLDYLEAGTVLLGTTAREPDIYDSQEDPVVPMSFRTDGRFVWTDAVAYYLRHYALSPDAALLQHMRGNAFRTYEVDAVAIHRALVAVTRPEPPD